MSEPAFFSDARLARRLESLVVDSSVVFAESARRVIPGSQAVTEKIAGGAALFLAAGSPVNGTAGLGFERPFTAEGAEAVESFFLSRGERPVVNLCPLAHASVHEVLAGRGWAVEGFENVLAREIGSSAETEPDPSRFSDAIVITEAESEEDRASWALVAATGFSSPLEPLPEQLSIGAVVAAKTSSRLFIAWVDGCAAGTGELCTAGGVGWLSGDSTLPRFRGRGVQQALQQHRLRIAAAEGCDIAVTESDPGSGSQRNMERLGFRVVYTRVDLAGPFIGEVDTRGGVGNV